MSVTQSAVHPQNIVLGSLGIVTGAAQQTRLVTPYQNVMPALVAHWNAPVAKQRTMIYGDTDPEFFKAFVANVKRGVDSRVIFDRSQGCGPTEKAQIEWIVSQGLVDGKDFVIGTSPESGQIVHIKACWNDDQHVEDGSLNYSPSALKQINTVCFSDWPAWAQYLNTVFDETWQFILTNEQKYQFASGQIPTEQAE